MKLNPSIKSAKIFRRRSRGGDDRGDLWRDSAVQVCPSNLTPQGHATAIVLSRGTRDPRLIDDAMGWHAGRPCMVEWVRFGSDVEFYISPRSVLAAAEGDRV